MHVPYTDIPTSYRPLPDENKGKSARDLIARFQSNINNTSEAPLKPRHSFGSNERFDGTHNDSGGSTAPSARFMAARASLDGSAFSQSMSISSSSSSTSSLSVHDHHDQQSSGSSIKAVDTSLGTSPSTNTKTSKTSNSLPSLSSSNVANTESSDATKHVEKGNATKSELSNKENVTQNVDTKEESEHGDQSHIKVEEHDIDNKRQSDSATLNDETTHNSNEAKVSTKKQEPTIAAVNDAGLGSRHEHEDSQEPPSAATDNIDSSSKETPILAKTRRTQRPSSNTSSPLQSPVKSSFEARTTGKLKNSSVTSTKGTSGDPAGKGKQGKSTTSTVLTSASPAKTTSTTPQRAKTPTSSSKLAKSRKGHVGPLPPSTPSATVTQHTRTKSAGKNDIGSPAARARSPSASTGISKAPVPASESAYTASPGGSRAGGRTGTPALKPQSSAARPSSSMSTASSSQHTARRTPLTNSSARRQGSEGRGSSPDTPLHASTTGNAGQKKALSPAELGRMQARTATSPPSASPLALSRSQKMLSPPSQQRALTPAKSPTRSAAAVGSLSSSIHSSPASTPPSATLARLMRPTLSSQAHARASPGTAQALDTPSKAKTNAKGALSSSTARRVNVRASGQDAHSRKPEISRDAEAKSVGGVIGTSANSEIPDEEDMLPEIPSEVDSAFDQHAQASEADEDVQGGVSESETDNMAPSLSNNSSSAPGTSIESDTPRPEDKVFTGFGANRPYGKIGLPLEAADNEDAGADEAGIESEHHILPQGMKVKQPREADAGGHHNEEDQAESADSGSPAAQQADFVGKWASREGDDLYKPAKSPGVASSKSTGGDSVTEGISPGEFPMLESGQAKKVPIWMRKGGE